MKASEIDRDVSDIEYTRRCQMNNKRILSVFLAAIMLVVAFGSIVQISDDASATDGTQSQGNVNVYFKGQNQSLDVTSVSAYDLYEAVVKAGTTLGYTVQTATGNDSWKTLINSAAGSYYDINKDYGTITSITSEGGVPVSIDNYSIYVYNTLSDETSFGWNPAIDAIGWYHPYNDYSATGKISNTEYSLASANIAIFYGSESPTFTGMKDLTSVNRFDSNYQYSFVLQGDVSPVSISVITEGADGFETMTVTEVEIAGGIFVYGWGSNAYEALKDALGSSNVEGQSDNYILHDMINYQYYTYYSWMDTILGKGTDTSDGYHYWSSYCYDSDGNEQYCDYTFGYYTTVAGNAFEHNDTFTVTYV